LLHFGLGFHSAQGSVSADEWPLLVALATGGTALVAELAWQALHKEFGSDLLAGISIVTAVVLHQYLAGTLVVLMLSGGQTLEAFAVRSASSVLEALAGRMPSVAHVKQGEKLHDVPLEEVGVGDLASVFPHEICPIDGVVVDGHGVMDESYLTGEPYLIDKAPGSEVLSGAVNGDRAIVIRATRLAVDSRYAKIMEVMRASAQRRPRMRRIADQLGAVYTPIAVAIGVGAWFASGDPMRFLSVLVIATPCPLLIGIPVAIIGSISLAAKRGIVVKDPIVLEKVDSCRVMILDKTGTLTYGKPQLTEVLTAPGVDADSTVALVASLERYSKHPLAHAILEYAQQQRLEFLEASEISERPGEGLRGKVAGRLIEVSGRSSGGPEASVELFPHTEGGLECLVALEGRPSALLRFRDEPRSDGFEFIRHLGNRHRFDRVLLVSGDRDSEVRYLAEKVGITEVHAGQSPEQKLELVRHETTKAQTVFVGDGINDAPALTAATVGIAFGQKSDITSEAAGAVIMDSTLEKVDEFLHISHRMRTIALQTALGGMAISIAGMLVASVGLLTPVAGAVAQELIDVVAVLNALRVAFPPGDLTDY
jgi:heavy metal translocating P-type ATPase